MNISELTKNGVTFTQLLGSNILQIIEDSIIVTDLEGKVVFWNKGAERIFGYQESEVLGKNISFLYPGVNQKQLKSELENILKGKDYIGEWKGLKKSGEEVWIKHHRTALKDNNGEIVGFIGISNDITEQKQTLKELLESEIKYQAIFENSGEGLLLIDENIIDCNKRLCNMWGYSKKEIIGKTPGDFSPQFQRDGTNSKEKASSYLAQVLKEGYVTFYWQHLTKKGEILETKITLSRIRIKGVHQVIAVVQNLSELFKYQNKLKTKSKELLEQNEEILQLNDELNESNIRLKIINRQIDLSEKKFRVAFKTSPDAININRLSDGSYIEINHGFTLLTGYEEDDVMNKNPYTLDLWFNKKDREKLIKELIEHKTVLNHEVKFRRKDSTIGIGLLSASIIDIDDEEYYISITRDISERKEYEQKLKEARKKAEESDMLKSAFLANMSHEIRTPMNAILGFAQLLKEKKISDEKQDKFLDIIAMRAQNLLQIINDIIDISKIEANQLKLEIHQFSLNRLLYELFSNFEAELVTQNKTNVKLDFRAELDKEASFIETDELRLKQILTNLISNAIKFTDEGKVEFGYKIKNGMLEFFVSDTGIGIPKDSIGQIFERFRQADDSSTREYGGTGLGLSISKQLVDMLGGKIWVKSEQNKGSIFYFTIPFKPKKLLSETKKTIEEKMPDLSNKRIMVVEDDQISMAYLEELLISTKVNIVKAYDGIDAVDKFKSEQNIDLVLMDIHLPRMSGNEATREIKKLNESIPVIAQSAFAMPEDRKESFKYGCDEYITKPIDSRLLFSTIKKFLI